MAKSKGGAKPKPKASPADASTRAVLPNMEPSTAPATKTDVGPPVEDGIAAAEAYNDAVRETVQNGPAQAGPGGVTTWPTEYGNPGMTIAPATPVKIEEGRAVEATPKDATDAAGAISDGA